MPDSALPDVTTKFRVDYSELTAAEKAVARANGEFAKGAKKAGDAVKASTTHTLRFTESLTTMIGRFGHVPPVVDSAARSLESMSSAASKGMSGTFIAAGVAVAAIGGLITVAEVGIKTYVDLGEKVLDFSRKTGVSAEQASRLVQAYEELGVSEETVANAAVKLSRAIETTPNKLAALGVVIARDSKGNVDLGATMLNVTKAYQQNGDAAQRNLLALTAFGRGGAALIPILNEDTARLAALEAQVQTIYTAEDLKRVHEYSIAQKELKRNQDDLGASIGQVLLPAQAGLLKNVNENIYVNEHLDAKMKQLYGNTVPQSRVALMDAAKALREEYEKAQDAQNQIDDLTESHKKAAQAAQEEADREEKLVGQLIAETNAAYGMKLADLAVSENALKLREAQDRVALAQDKVAASQKAVNDARSSGDAAAYKKAVDELTKAQDDLTQAQNDVTRTTIDNEKNIYAAAEAARQLQKDTDIAATGQQDAAKETQAYVDKLYAEAQTLDKNSALRKNIEGLIEQIGLVPTQVVTTFDLKVSGYVPKFGSERSQREYGYASGGDPPVNKAVVVGEHGPELAVFKQPATVYPAGGTPALGGDNLSVVVNAETNADPQDIARDAAWELRKMRRNH